MTFIFFLIIIWVSQHPILARGMCVEDVLSLQKPHTVLMSPDGRHVVYKVKDILWVDTHTIGSGSAPYWRPDSQSITYLTNEGRCEFNINTKTVTNIQVTLSITTEKSAIQGLSIQISPTESIWIDSPHYSPDGEWIYFISQKEPLSDWLRIPYLAAYNLKTKTLKHFTQTGEPGIIRTFTYEKNAVYYLAESGFSYQLHRIDLNDGKIDVLTPGTDIWEEFSFSEDKTQMAYVRERADQPPEVYKKEILSGKEIQVSHLNDKLRTLELGKARLITWTNAENTTIEGLLITPPDYQPTQKYPLLVCVHGGPGECFSNRFANGRWNYPTQVLSAKGWLILMPNPRGSTGYTTVFKNSLKNKWGVVDSEDVLAGVYELIQSGSVDTQRIAVAGWSYGGYLAAALITKAPTLFKGASIGAGFSDLTTLYGTIDIPDWIECYFEGKTPYTHPDFFNPLSPIYQMDKVKIPVLIQGGVADRRVPISQARLLYRRLKKGGTPVKLSEFEGEGHIFSNPENRRRCMQENIDWLSQLK